MYETHNMRREKCNCLLTLLHCHHNFIAPINNLLYQQIQSWRQSIHSAKVNKISDNYIYLKINFTTKSKTKIQKTYCVRSIKNSLMHIQKLILWSNSITFALTQGSPILRFFSPRVIFGRGRRRLRGIILRLIIVLQIPLDACNQYSV